MPVNTKVRIRTQELRYVRAGDIVPHPLNWRTHPEEQRQALDASLTKIGFAGALDVVERDGHMVNLDGHLRADMLPDMVLPVLVHDFDDAEAREYIASKDLIGSKAGSDLERAKALLAEMGDPDSFASRLLAGMVEALPMTVEPIAPEAFAEYDETIETEHTCPKCGYEWSGGQ